MTGYEGNGISRRGALRIGAVGSAAAGGNLLAACGILGGSDKRAPKPGAPHSGDSSAASVSPSIPPLLTPAGYTTSARRPTWSQEFQVGHGWQAEGEGVGSAEQNDTSIFLTGGQAVRVTTNGRGKQSCVRVSGLPAVDLSNKMIRLTFRVEDVEHLHKLAFYVGTGVLDDSFHWQFHTHQATGANYVQSGEWVVVNLQWADVTSASGAFKISPAGMPSATSFTAMSFAAYDDAHGPITYRLQAVEVFPDTHATFPHGAVSITFDDSYASVFDLALPAMKKHGFLGTVYNIAEAADTHGYLTLAQMRQLQNQSRWEMAGHAYAKAAHNAGYSTLTSAQIKTDMGRLRDWLDNSGFHSEHFAYPHGDFGSTADGVAVDRIAAQYFATARSIISEITESFIPAMPYRLKALTGLTDGTGMGGSPPAAVTAAGAKLDRCANDGDWLILCFHDLTSAMPTSSTQIGVKAFAGIMDAIAERGVPVLTIGEAMKHYM